MPEEAEKGAPQAIIARIPFVSKSILSNCTKGREKGGKVYQRSTKSPSGRSKERPGGFWAFMRYKKEACEDSSTPMEHCAPVKNKKGGKNP